MLTAALTWCDMPLHVPPIGLQVASPSEQQAVASRASERVDNASNGYMVPYQQHTGFVLRNAPMLRAIPRFCEPFQA